MNSTKIELWDGTEASGLAIFKLVELSYPLIARIDRGDPIGFLQSKSGPFRKELYVARDGKQMIGFAMLCKAPARTSVRLMGAVHPDHRLKSIGKMLFRHLENRIETYPHVREILGDSFESSAGGTAFLEKAGFMTVDRSVWSERSLHTPLPDWITSLGESLEKEGLRFISGDTFSSIREDWKEAWGEFEMNAVLNMPGNVTRDKVPFETWCPRLEPPDLHLEHTVLALAGKELAGAIYLGPVTENRINIEFTGVAPPHRKKGLSKVLKMKGFELAISLGAHTITTQNLETNPLQSSNRQLGFTKQDVMVKYRRDVARNAVEEN